MGDLRENANVSFLLPPENMRKLVIFLMLPVCEERERWSEMNQSNQSCHQ